MYPCKKIRQGPRSIGWAGEAEMSFWAFRRGPTTAVSSQPPVRGQLDVQRRPKSAGPGTTWPSKVPQTAVPGPTGPSVLSQIAGPKIRKCKKWKSGFRYVKYVLSWGLPSRKKGEKALKKPTEKTSIFHPKSIKNQSKNRGKRHSQQKSMKKRSLRRLFWEKIDFWWFLGSQGVPKNC